MSAPFVGAGLPSAIASATAASCAAFELAIICAWPLRSAENLRQLLDCAECDAVTRGENECGDDRRANKFRAEQFANAGTLELSGVAFALPLRRFGKKWANQNQRQRGNHAGNQRVTPRFVSAVNGGKIERNFRGDDIDDADQKSAER